MKALRTHYYYLASGKARCGNPLCSNILHRNWTRIPEKVTCKTCKKLMEGEVK